MATAETLDEAGGSRTPLAADDESSQGSTRAASREKDPVAAAAQHRNLCHHHLQELIKIRRCSTNTVACQTDQTEEFAGGIRTVSNRGTTMADVGSSSGGSSDAASTSSDGVLRLMIKNFRDMTETVRGPIKRIQGVHWRIMVMPRQHVVQKKGTQKCLGFFLQCCPEAFSDQWSCSASAELRLISQKSNVPHFTRKTNHVYTAKENDWGYSCFMTWADILDENQGYIKDDRVILEVSVKAEPPKNILTLDEFRKQIQSWFDLAQMQYKRGCIDLAIEANAQALKFCKDRDKECRERLEEQKAFLIEEKLVESIQRIEKGPIVNGKQEEDAATQMASLKAAITNSTPKLAGTAKNKTAPKKDAKKSRPQTPPGSPPAARAIDASKLLSGAFNKQLLTLPNLCQSWVKRTKAEDELFEKFVAELQFDETSIEQLSRDSLMVQFVQEQIRMLSMDGDGGDGGGGGGVDMTAAAGEARIKHAIEQAHDTFVYKMASNRAAEFQARWDGQPVDQTPIPEQVDMPLDTLFTAEAHRARVDRFEWCMRNIACKSTKYCVFDDDDFSEYGSEPVCESCMHQQQQQIEELPATCDGHSQTDALLVKQEPLPKDPTPVEPPPAKKTARRVEVVQNVRTETVRTTETNEGFAEARSALDAVNATYKPMSSPASPDLTLPTTGDNIDAMSAATQQQLSVPLSAGLPPALSDMYEPASPAGMNAMPPIMPMEFAMRFYDDADSAETPPQEQDVKYIEDWLKVNIKTCWKLMKTGDDKAIRMLAPLPNMGTTGGPDGHSTAFTEQMSHQVMAALSVIAMNCINTKRVVDRASDFVRVVSGKASNEKAMKAAKTLHKLAEREDAFELADDVVLPQSPVPLSQEEEDFARLYQRLLNKHDFHDYMLEREIRRIDECRQAVDKHVAFLRIGHAENLYANVNAVANRVQKLEHEIRSLKQLLEETNKAKGRADEKAQKDLKAAQLQLKQEKEKVEKAAQAAKEKKAEMKKLEKRAKEANQLESEKHELQEKCDQLQKENKELTRRAGEEAAKWKRELASVVDSRKNTLGELSSKTTDLTKATTQLDAANARLKKLEAMVATERKTAETEKKTEAERAKRAEIQVLEQRMDFGVSRLEAARDEAKMRAKEMQEAAANPARPAAEVELYKESLGQWNTRITDLDNMIKNIKNDFEKNIEAIRGGKKLEQLPKLALPSAGTAPRVVSVAALAVEPPHKPPPGVIGSSRASPSSSNRAPGSPQKTSSPRENSQPASATGGPSPLWPWSEPLGNISDILSKRSFDPLSDFMPRQQENGWHGGSSDDWPPSSSNSSFSAAPGGGMHSQMGASPAPIGQPRPPSSTAYPTQQQHAASNGWDAIDSRNANKPMPRPEVRLSPHHAQILDQLFRLFPHVEKERVIEYANEFCSVMKTNLNDIPVDRAVSVLQRHILSKMQQKTRQQHGLDGLLNGYFDVDRQLSDLGPKW